MKNQDLLSVKEVAGILKISPQAVYKRIKLGRLKAIKIGKTYAISKKELIIELHKPLSEQDKYLIDKTVDMAYKDYREAIRKIGKE